MENRWLTKDLQSEIRITFEPRYGRSLSESEVVQIASNLVSYVEHYSKFK